MPFSPGMEEPSSDNRQVVTTESEQGIILDGRPVLGHA
ncbi:hypothetical protein STIAU_4412 [Stigmatella aurantiaca DW4/3-1]|uniref:Uncharacterized protein n=1 Tax=Stigmatella aurantiaca (strain DW4/3-1) TaxID=378806 RepID=Q08WW9_STIAD|nr:hypothetical protein STIAU_4412 [Stigmatella aurantiaca DW4/3-1]